MKIIETAFIIECGGLRLKRKGLITHLKLLARIPVKSAHCKLSMANEPKYTAAESAECWNRQSLMVKMA